MPQFVFFLVCLALCGCVSSVRADDSGCYTSGSVAGIVIATVVVTLVMGGLAAAFIWYLWKQRKVGYGDNKSLEKPIVCPPMSPDKQVIAKESNDYAFDNPYFKDDDSDTVNADAAEKGQADYRADNGDIAASQNAKASSNGTTGNHSHKKSRPFSSLPFHVVFHPSGKNKQRATMDDTYISKHLERITVPLRGHDFTGLGFNICGNMRDGIFVKDVLHRGPASESGKIKAGDRIVGVTVSFGAMVYEDALTILSYASPYDVKLEVEKAPPTSSGGPHLPSSSPKRLGTSTSFRSNGQRRLFHPLYRSQSIDDLTQIGKDGFGTINSSGSGRDSSSSATPKRSQSVEASNGGLKARPAFMVKTDETTKSSSSKGSRKSSTSSCESTAKATTPIEKTRSVLDEVEVPCIKKETAKSARFRVEQAYLKTEALHKVIPPMKPTRDAPEDKQTTENDATDKPAESATTSAADNFLDEPSDHPVSSTDVPGVPEMDADIEKPTAPPRKVNTPKRKAPAPPPVPASKTETSVVVHRTDDLSQQPEVSELEKTPLEADSSEIPPPPPSSELPPVSDESTPIEKNPSKNGKSLPPATEALVSPSEVPTDSVFCSAEKIADPGIGSSDNSSLASADHPSANMDKGDQNTSSGKRKASSLGDLTQLEHGNHKRASTSSAILERAVSLDLQQSLPGENLTKQKKILHAPTFEDDNEEDNREDTSTEMSGPGLKRWDNGLDKVFPTLPNGEAEFASDMTDAVEEKVSSKPSVKVEVNHTDIIRELNSELVLDSTSDKPAASLENDLPIGELDFPNLQGSTTTTLLTSTPVKKIIEMKDITKNEDDDSMDDIPYLASVRQQNREDMSSKSPSKTTPSSTTTIFSPVSISIPVIKPDLTHFEKLPSPPPTSTHPGLEPSWRMTKTITSDESGKTSLERISIQSLYRPIFSSKEINNTDDSLVESEKMVNGNESDGSEHYSTAQENTSTSSVETSTLSVTLSNPVTKEVTVKAPSTIAGFAKTLIIPGPNEVENLLSLAAEPNTPPPTLEPPAKPVENE